MASRCFCFFGSFSLVRLMPSLHIWWDALYTSGKIQRMPSVVIHPRNFWIYNSSWWSYIFFNHGVFFIKIYRNNYITIIHYQHLSTYIFHNVLNLRTSSWRRGTFVGLVHGSPRFGAGPLLGRKQRNRKQNKRPNGCVVVVESQNRRKLNEFVHKCLVSHPNDPCLLKDVCFSKVRDHHAPSFWKGKVQWTGGVKGAWAARHLRGMPFLSVGHVIRANEKCVLSSSSC